MRRLSARRGGEHIARRHRHTCHRQTKCLPQLDHYRLRAHASARATHARSARRQRWAGQCCGAVHPTRPRSGSHRAHSTTRVAYTVRVVGGAAKVVRLSSLQTRTGRAGIRAPAACGQPAMRGRRGAGSARARGTEPVKSPLAGRTPRRLRRPRWQQAALQTSWFGLELQAGLVVPRTPGGPVVDCCRLGLGV